MLGRSGLSKLRIAGGLQKGIVPGSIVPGLLLQQRATPRCRFLGVVGEDKGCCEVLFARICISSVC